MVEEFAGFFSQDLSHHQLRRLKQYLTGLITDSKPTIRRIASRQVDPVDQSSLNRFLTLYPWDRERVNKRRLELLQAMEETRWHREGVVAIDDTLLPKTGRKMPGAGRLWDHNSGRYIHAQCLVTSHYVDQDKDYPIGYRQYLKRGGGEAKRHGFKTKVELAMELVDECEALGIPAENYVFDAWFLSRELSKHIEAYGKGWVSRLKSNRIIHTEDGRMKIREWEETLPRQAFKEVQVLGKRHWAYTQVLDVNKLGKARVV
ncbi:MAG: transposase, partial [Candidatus Bathyarchaeia archaeon]